MTERLGKNRCWVKQIYCMLLPRALWLSGIAWSPLWEEPEFQFPPPAVIVAIEFYIYIYKVNCMLLGAGLSKILHWHMNVLSLGWEEWSFLSNPKEKGQQRIFENKSSSPSENKYFWCGMVLLLVYHCLLFCSKWFHVESLLFVFFLQSNDVAFFFFFFISSCVLVRAGFRLQGWGMHWPLQRINFSKKMGLSGFQVLLLQLQIVKERVNSFV